MTSRIAKQNIDDIARCPLPFYQDVRLVRDLLGYDKADTFFWQNAGGEPGLIDWAVACDTISEWIDQEFERAILAGERMSFPSRPETIDEASLFSGMLEGSYE